MDCRLGASFSRICSIPFLGRNVGAEGDSAAWSDVIVAGDWRSASMESFQESVLKHPS